MFYNRVYEEIIEDKRATILFIILIKNVLRPFTFTSKQIKILKFDEKLCIYCTVSNQLSIVHFGKIGTQMMSTVLSIYCTVQ
jgi:hypothetical protein